MSHSHPHNQDTVSRETAQHSSVTRPAAPRNSNLGVGIGLRSAHHSEIEQRLAELQLESVSWLEIHSENYFDSESDLSKSLSRIAQHRPISCHGVGLSLGSVDEPSKQHIQQLSELVKRVDPVLVSDHLSWSENGGVHYNDLLPLPYTEEALDVFCRNLSIVQHALGRLLLIENPSSYLRFAHSTIDEWEFLNEVQRRTECRLLLDLNNVHVSAFNHGFDEQVYLSKINAQAIDEIHLAGFTKKRLPQGEIWIDTHSRPVSNEVWDLYANWTKQHGAHATLIEWDSDLPTVDELVLEAFKAQQIIGTEAQIELNNPTAINL